MKAPEGVKLFDFTHGVKYAPGTKNQTIHK
jgi:hypothetical protein